MNSQLENNDWSSKFLEIDSMLFIKKHTVTIKQLQLGNFDTVFHSKATGASSESFS